MGELVMSGEQVIFRMSLSTATIRGTGGMPPITWQASLDRRIFGTRLLRKSLTDANLTSLPCLQLSPLVRILSPTEPRDSSFYWHMSECGYLWSNGSTLNRQGVISKA